MSKNDEIEDLKQKEKYLEVLNSFALILFEAKSIEEIVWSVTKHAMAKLNYYDCVIYLYDPNEDKLIQHAAFGPKNPSKEEIKDPIKLTPGEGIVGEVFANGKGEIVNDTSKDPRYVVDDEVRFSEITIPLMHKGEVVGIIDSEHPEKNFFTQRDFDLMTTVAAMVSTKIEQAKAQEELLLYKENLELLVEEKTSELKKQNEQKQLLIHEIHHRVKNNMQIIISLLNLQINANDNIEEEGHLIDFQNRIRSMAIIHERLYLEDNINLISSNDFFAQLIDELSSSIKTNKHIAVSHKIADAHLFIDFAIPLGLILNELITNSYKHAFQDTSDGLIQVEFQVHEDQCKFIYTDNGLGFDPSSVPSTSFGIELINILVSQIDAQMKISTVNGVRCEITMSVDAMSL